MRRPFAVLTILAAAAAVVFGVLRREPVYFARMSAADIASGRFPRAYLTSSIYDVDLAPGVEHFLETARESADATERLAAAEMLAAGLLSTPVDPAVVAFEYERLLEDYPNSPLVHYRYGAYLLSRLQRLLSEKGVAFTEGADLEVEDLARRARLEFAAAANFDPQNSLLYFETAYSYWATGDREAALEWLERALAAPEFDAGDDVVTSGCARLVMGAGAPELEALLTTYQVSRVAPSLLAGRMEKMTAGFLSERSMVRRALPHEDFLDFLAPFEDLSVKLFHTATVLRQMQASFVTGGILWRRVAREAALKGDSDLAAAARTQIAKASYRYLLAGAGRAAAGLAPQQGIVELDIPLDLRLPFSRAAQRLAGVFFMFVIVLALPLAGAALASLRIKGARQLALSLGVLAVFSALGYVASFYATAGERARTARGLSTRLEVIMTVPDKVRAAGDLAGKDDFDVEVAKKMLAVPNYTYQAARVLAYVGSRDCFDALMAALEKPDQVRSAEILRVLREETGLNFGYDADGSRSNNYSALRAWLAWWREARDSYPESLKSPAAPRG